MAVWQQSMIALARSSRLTAVVHRNRRLSAMAGQFVAGPTAQDAVRVADDLSRRGITTSAYFLGEYVTDEAVIEATVEQLLGVIALLAEAGLEVHVSVDPTQVGLMRDPALARANITRLAEAVRDAPTAASSATRPRALMLDMEDADVVDFTLDLHGELQDAGLPVAVTVQTYLHRSSDDARALAARGARVRLVKGAFAPPASIGATSRAEIDSRYRRVLAQMLSAQSLAAGTYVTLGTHDHFVIEEAFTQAQAHGWPQDRLEVEMLYGVRPDLQADLVDRGLPLRLYLPYGQMWFPYVIRRVGEAPRNLRFAVRALLGARGQGQHESA